MNKNIFDKRESMFYDFELDKILNIKISDKEEEIIAKNNAKRETLQSARS